MKTKEIKIEVSPEVAEAYENIPREKQERLKVFISVWLKEENFDEATEDLEQVMDEVGKKAQDRGTTPTILKEILDEG